MNREGTHGGAQEEGGGELENGNIRKEDGVRNT